MSDLHSLLLTLPITLGLIVLSFVGTGLLLRWLQWRVRSRPRVSGARGTRRPYRRAARICRGFASPATLMVTLVVALVVPRWGLAVWFGFGVCYLWLVLANAFDFSARRVAGQLEPSAIAAVAPRVLLLRPFTSDMELTFPAPRWISAVRHVTLATFLSGGLTDTFGTVVALGSPQDRLPPAVALVRIIYETDDHWQERVLELAHAVQVIVMSPADTVALSWEMRALRRHNLQTKLYVVLPPARSYRLMPRVLLRIAGRRESTAGDVAERFCDAGYQIDPSHLQPGSVVTFSHRGTSMVLAEALGNDPDSYIAAMVNDLDNRAPESRLVDVEDEALVEVLRAREPPPRLPPVAPDPPQSTPTTAPGTVGRSELPLTAAAAPQLRKWPRRWILFQGAIVGVLIALWVATRESYFLGVDEARGDIVVVYQGLPYDLPLGAKLYSIHELSGVALQLVPVARRETFTDHRLRSRKDAENLLLQLEQGSIAK